jgi:hypothetical protein
MLNKSRRLPSQGRGTVFEMPVNTALGDAVASHTEPDAESPAPVAVVSPPGSDGLTGKQRDFARA